MMEEFDFGPEEKRNRIFAEVVGNPKYQSAKNYGTPYITKSKFVYDLNIRIFQGPEVEWEYITSCSFDQACYLIKKELARLHWTLKLNPEELDKFKNWKE